MRKALYILGDLEDQDIVWLNQAGRVRTLSDGELLIQAGIIPDDLFIIIGGECAVVSANGRQIALLSIGDITGEMSFVEKRPPEVAVKALGSAQVLAIHRSAMLVKFAEDLGFAARFYRALSVFLSDRLRSATHADSKAATQELDDGLLDTLHVAGDRFTRLLDLLAGRTR